MTEPEPALAPSGLERVWERLARPFDTMTVIEALLGLPTRVGRQLIGAVVATCPQAEALLDGMPITLRSLAIATTDRPVRMYGEIRGPILWGETISARRASAGDEGVYVCATTSKAFDTDENRVLVAALSSVRQAGHDVEALVERGYDDEVLRRARYNGTRAVRFLEHRTLASVARTRITGRQLKRTRAGSRRRTYQAALAMVERSAEPLTIEHLEEFADARTLAQLNLVGDLLDGLEASGVHIPRLRVDEGALVAGPLWFRHQGGRGERSQLHGVVLNGVLVDVPDDVREKDRVRAAAQLDQRSGDRPSVVVLGPDDVRAALERAAVPALKVERRSQPRD